MKEIHEGITKVIKYELLGKLPNPFVFNNGEKVKTVNDWNERKKEIYENVVDLQFGTMPPKPEFLEVEPLCYGTVNMFRIKTGTRKKPITFNMSLFKACKSEKAPVVITGDLCFGRMYNKEMIESFTNNDINLVMFNRTELAPDIAGYNLEHHVQSSDSGEYKLGKEILEGLQTGNCGGQVKETYPEYSFGAIGAWAWGYSRCVDALEIIGNVDMNLITFTGHSRGAKTAALAGALDERAKIVNPNATCAGGYSSYRINIDVELEDGKIDSSERLSNIFKNFPAWMGQGMKAYVGREEELPFDSHDLKAMIAPRVLYVSEAAHDVMANPVGSYQTTEAAAEVYKFLGCEENLIWSFRCGGHDQNMEDIGNLINVINHVRDGEVLSDKFFKLPFKKFEKAYDWSYK